jgi:hypothetical protein
VATWWVFLWHIGVPTASFVGHLLTHETKHSDHYATSLLEGGLVMGIDLVDVLFRLDRLQLCASKQSGRPQNGWQHLKGLATRRSVEVGNGQATRQTKHPIRLD